jgi:hypothetical protein
VLAESACRILEIPLTAIIMESSSDNLEVLKVASASCIAWTVLFQMWPVPSAEKDVEGAKSRCDPTLYIMACAQEPT